MILNGKFLNNLKGHLKKEHSLKYVEVEEIERFGSRKKQKRSPSRKWTVTQNSYR